MKLQIIILTISALTSLFIRQRMKKSSQVPTISPKPKETYISRDEALPFDISGPRSWESTLSYEATYFGQNQTAKFAIRFNGVTSRKSVLPGSGDGMFLSHPDSQNGDLLFALKRVLDATRLPNAAARTAELPFTFVVLDTNLSISEDGGFTSVPKGNWTTFKLFFEDEDVDPEIGAPEVYLNLNSKLSKGEFAIKDSDYGDALLEKLSTVL